MWTAGIAGVTARRGVNYGRGCRPEDALDNRKLVMNDTRLLLALRKPDWVDALVHAMLGFCAVLALGLLLRETIHLETRAPLIASALERGGSGPVELLPAVVVHTNLSAGKSPVHPGTSATSLERSATSS